MPATFTTPLINQVAGGLVSASQWDAEFTNLYNNLIPAGIDTYSGTDVQMQTATDPFPGGSTSHATSLGGELERIRYMLNLIIGGSNWYNHPPTSLTTLNAVPPIIPSGTVMLFYQSAAPTGWTKVTTQNDKALRVVSGTGGVSGGTTSLSAGITLAHSHTVSSHSHTISHRHTVPIAPGAGGVTVPTIASWNQGSESLVTDRYAAGLSGATGQTDAWLKSKDSDTANSGTASPGTDSQLANITLAYIDVILASKN